MRIVWKNAAPLLCAVVAPSSAFLTPSSLTARGSNSLSLSKPNEPGDWFDSEPQNFGGGGGGNVMPQLTDPFASSTRSGRNQQQLNLEGEAVKRAAPFDASKFQRYDKKSDGSMLDGSDGVSNHFPKKSQASRRPVLPNNNNNNNVQERRPNLPNQGSSRPRSVSFGAAGTNNKDAKQKTQAQRNAERMRAMYQQGLQEDVVRKPTLPNVSSQAKSNADRLLNLYQQAEESSPVSGSTGSFHHESSWNDWQQGASSTSREETSQFASRISYDMYSEGNAQKPTLPKVTPRARDNADKLRALYQEEPLAEQPSFFQPRGEEEDWVSARTARNGGEAAQSKYYPQKSEPRRQTSSTGTGAIQPLEGYYTVDSGAQGGWQDDLSRPTDDMSQYDDDEDDYSWDTKTAPAAQSRAPQPYSQSSLPRQTQGGLMQQPDSFDSRRAARQQPQRAAEAPRQSQPQFREPERFEEPRPASASFQQAAYSGDNQQSRETEQASFPFQVQMETVERYSNAPMPQMQEMRYQQDVPMARATVRERTPAPVGGFPVPQRPGAIMPLEPLGGPLGGPPASMWGSGRSEQWHEGARRTSSMGPGPWLDRFVGDEVVQGGSRKTFSTTHQDQTIVELGSKGRPIYATAQVWQGPGNTPASMSMYSEDGGLRPWRAAFQNTDRGTPSTTLDIRNDGGMEFPLEASVIGKHDGTKGMSKEEKDFVEEMEFDYVPSKFKVTQTVQGQSLKYFNVKAGVDAVMVELSSEGRPMFIQVELWKGPDAVKQCAEIYSDNGSDRHWSAIIETHGQECTVAIRNVGPALVYPVKASVDPIIAPVPMY